MLEFLDTLEMWLIAPLLWIFLPLNVIGEYIFFRDGMSLLEIVMRNIEANISNFLYLFGML